MGRYGICEYEVDTLLRQNVFVDLYKIIKNSILIGEPGYSIKNVEKLYRGKRKTEVKSGGESVIMYENWRVIPTDLIGKPPKYLIQLGNIIRKIVFLQEI